MMNKKCIPNGNGSVQFFKEMQTDQFEANTLDEEGKVSDGQIIMYSKRAFTQCGHEATHTMAISTTWNKDDTEYRTNNSSTYRETIWVRCIALYNKEMKILHNNDDTKTNHQANHTTSILLDRVKELELGWE